MGVNNRTLFWVQGEIQICTDAENTNANAILVLGRLFLKPFFRPFDWKRPALVRHRTVNLLWFEADAGPFRLYGQWTRKKLTTRSKFNVRPERSDA